jgi:hypothetical protein
MVVNIEVGITKKENNMQYRKTKLYKNMDSYTACSIAEGFSGEEHTEQEVLTAWQYLVDTGQAWSLQGWYGRNAMALIKAGYIRKAGE